MIDLKDAVIIGRGNERICYLHPQDKDLIIKVPIIGSGQRKQNILDHYYQEALKRKGVPFTYIPKQYGFIQTTAGEGLLMDCIRDTTDQVAQTILQKIQNKEIDKIVVERILLELYAYFFEYGIVMVDISLGNIVCYMDNNQWKFYVIDGLGGRRPGFKVWLNVTFGFWARRKLQKQWQLWEVELAKAFN